jgi:hypothetical protein
MYKHDQTAKCGPVETSPTIGHWQYGGNSYALDAFGPARRLVLPMPNAIRGSDPITHAVRFKEAALGTMWLTEAQYAQYVTWAAKWDKPETAVAAVVEESTPGEPEPAYPQPPTRAESLAFRGRKMSRRIALGNATYSRATRNRGAK